MPRPPMTVVIMQNVNYIYQPLFPRYNMLPQFVQSCVYYRGKCSELALLIEVTLLKVHVVMVIPECSLLGSILDMNVQVVYRQGPSYLLCKKILKVVLKPKQFVILIFFLALRLIMFQYLYCPSYSTCIVVT